jgi:hypothetical protein
MFIYLLLEVVNSSIGLYNLTKGVYDIYYGANKAKTYYTEYYNYVEIQKNSNDKLTESQFICIEEDFIMT